MRFLVKFMIVGLGLLPIKGLGQVQERWVAAKIKPVDSLSVWKPVSVLKPVPTSFYHQTLGFMCKSEWKVEQFTRVPLRVRLGSLAQSNYLEGKR
jgi:hypothetical protein